MTNLNNNEVVWPNDPTINSPLYEFFIGGVKEIYWSENHLVRALLKMSNSTINKDLQRLISGYIDITKKHAYRLEQIFELLDEPIDARKCEAMSGLCKESLEILEYTEEGTTTRDAGITLITERISQFEASSYQSLIRIARTIGREDIAALLHESLYEEKNCNDDVRNFSDITLQKAHIAA